MRRIVGTLLLTLLVNVTNAQWTQMPLPGGGLICELAITSDTTLIAGTTKGCFRSFDKGESWESLVTRDPLLGKFAYPFAVDSILFVGIVGLPGSSLLRSTDNGANWIPVNSGLPNTNHIGSITSIDTNIFISMSWDGIFRSVNNGLSWTPVNKLDTLYTRINTRWVNAIDTVLFASTGDRLFCSKNYGDVWTEISIPDVEYISNIVSIGSSLFIGTSGTFTWGVPEIKSKGIYRSDNNGENWIAVNSGLTNYSDLSFNYLAAIDTNIFALANNKVFLSTDNGNNWVLVNDSIVDSAIYLRLFKTSGKDLFAGGSSSNNRGGIFKSIDKSNSWKEINSGLTAYNTNDLVFNGSKIFVGSDIGVFLSNDNGESWIKINAGLPKDRPVTCLASIGTKIFAGTANYSGDMDNGGIFLFNEMVNSWEKIYPGKLGENILSISCFVINETSIFAGTNLGVLRSNDFGTNWTELMDSIIGPSIFCIVRMETDIFVSSSEGVLRSTDNGGSWFDANSGLPLIKYQNWPMFTTSLAVLGSNLIAGTGNAIHQGAGVFLSTDRGATWMPVNSGLPPQAYITSIKTIDSKVFVATDINGVFVSDDTCKNWYPIDLGLPNNSSITSLMVGIMENNTTTIKQGYLFAETDYCGLWRSPDFNIISTSNKLEVPDMERIINISYQTDHVSISYNLTAPCHIDVALYSISGICSSVILNRMESAGTHAFKISYNSFPSGVYILNFKAGYYQYSKKLVLLK
ncbi:MAG: hypothetical protein GQ564_09550 [Bacteroidales bacterium]|nr:hypothetical protein [Bacteroidales bacterium]